MRTGHVILAAPAILAVAGCGQNYLCTTEVHPSLRITARSALDGTLLSGLYGTVRDNGELIPIGCSTERQSDACDVVARGPKVDVHLERDGYRPWDSMNVQLIRQGPCETPVLVRLEAAMTPANP